MAIFCVFYMLFPELLKILCVVSEMWLSYSVWHCIWFPLLCKEAAEGLFSPSQICVRVKGLEIIVPLPRTDLMLQVACYPPFFTLTPKHSGNFSLLQELSTLLQSHTKAFWQLKLVLSSLLWYNAESFWQLRFTTLAIQPPSLLCQNILVTSLYSPSYLPSFMLTPKHSGKWNLLCLLFFSIMPKHSGNWSLFL